MKFYLPNDSRGSVGGGWTFRNNFVKNSNIGTIHDADIAIISGISMITKETYYAVKNKMPYILRVDGIPEPWRNPRINIFKRLKDWANNATGIVFQSHFTKDTVGKLIQPKVPQTVIYNGVDTEVFNTNAPQILQNKDNNWLYIHHRQDPNKRPEVVVHYARYHMKDTETLVWVGSSPDKWDDFKLGIPPSKKVIRIKGTQPPEELAKYMASCKYILHPSFADPCPNTLIEALCCGCVPAMLEEKSSTVNISQLYGEGYDFSAKRMTAEYVAFARKILKS